MSDIRRIEKVNELLKRQIGEIFLRQIGIPDVLITITRVDTASNFITSNIYVSVFPEKKFDDVFKVLDKEVYDIQQALNDKLRMRPIPKIIFKREKSLAPVEKVEKIIKDLKKDEENSK